MMSPYRRGSGDGRKNSPAGGSRCGSHCRGFASAANFGLGSLVVVPLLKSELLFLFDVGDHTQGIREGLRGAGEIPLSIAAGLADAGQDFTGYPFLIGKGLGLVRASEEKVKPLLGDSKHFLLSSGGGCIGCTPFHKKAAPFLRRHGLGERSSRLKVILLFRIVVAPPQTARSPAP